MKRKDYNLYQIFLQQFVNHADKPLLITENDTVYSYADVDKESSRLAGLLKEMGVKVGDRVSVQVEKSPQALCLYLACLRAGLVFHPLNTGYQPAELEYFLANAEPVLVVCDSGSVGIFQPLVEKFNIAHLLTLDANGQGNLIEKSRHHATDFTSVQRDKADLAALLYSSGTTGAPKGIMLSHNNLADNARSLVEAWGFNERDILLHALPIFHVHGLFVALNCVFASGASMRWLKAFKPDLVIKVLPECTVMMGVPTFYTRLLSSKQFDRKTVRNIRLFISGSAPLLTETFVSFEQRTGHRILERYGMTETGMNTSNPLHGLRKAGTVGLPLPGVELRICDDNDRTLTQGNIGNLQVRGANVFQGYWRMPEKTAEDFSADGFFNTGDKAVIDDEGYVSIVGRAKDMVISGGLNVYPKELELLLDEMSAVKESAVIGLPHEDFGEAVVAVIVLHAGASLEESDIIDGIKSTVAKFKVPKRVIFIDELPRNTMGKVQKNVLRDRYKDLL